MAVTLTPYAGLDNSTVENPEALYLVGGSGTDLDGKLVRAVALVDPATGAAMVPGSVTFSSLSIADGADVAEGSTSDSAGDPTVLGLLKAILSDMDPMSTAVGTQTDAVDANTVMGQLKRVTNGISVPDGLDQAQGATTDAAGDPTVIGQLKQVSANTTPGPVPLIYSHDFTAPGTGATQDGSSDPPVAYALQVSGVDVGGASQAASAWDVSFQQSLDQVNWVNTLTHISGTNANGAITHATASASVYVRAVVNAVTLGSAHALRVSFVCKS